MIDYTFGPRRVAQLFVERWVKESDASANNWLNMNYTKEEQAGIFQYLPKEFAKYNLQYTPPKGE